MNKISVVIPTYNEGDYIFNLIDELKKAKNVGEIILVDDQSKEIFSEKYKKTLGIAYHYNEKNLGKDLTVLKGIELSKFDYILVLDADLLNVTSRQIESLDQFLPKTKLISLIRGGDYKWAKILGSTYLTLGEHLFSKKIFNQYKDRLFNGKKWNLDNEFNRISQELPEDESIYVEFKNVKHQFKATKLGFLTGMIDDIKMINDVYIKRYKVIGVFTTLFKSRKKIKNRIIV